MYNRNCKMQNILQATTLLVAWLSFIPNVVGHDVEVETGNALCQFESYKAVCYHDIQSKYAAKVVAIVNNCNQPVDVTFKVTIRDKNHKVVKWQHTFINSHEIQRVKGFSHDLDLHVHMEPHTSKIHIQAQFRIEDLHEKYFMDSEFSIDPTINCGELSFGVGATVLVVFVILVSLIVVGVPIFVWYKRKKHIERRNALMKNMEPPAKDVYKDRNMLQLGTITEAQAETPTQNVSNSNSLPPVTTCTDQYRLSTMSDMSNGQQSNVSYGQNSNVSYGQNSNVSYGQQSNGQNSNGQLSNGQRRFSGISDYSNMSGLSALSAGGLDRMRFGTFIDPPSENYS